MDSISSEKQFLRCEINNRIISLSGTNMAVEKQKIEEEINSGKNPIFVLKTESGKLSSYIDWMYDEEELSNKMLNRFMLCKHIEFNDLVTVVVKESEDYRPRNIGELISILLKFDEKYVCIVIENNDRTLLADILQQLIYIEYPINKIDIKLRKEFKDAEKTKRFMDKAQVFFEQSVQAQERLCELYIDAPTEEEKNELLEIRAKTIESYKKIAAQIEKANNVEMKIALAASKKTGKSVLANSMIEMELAPTSLELATPNTCIYKKSPDDKFRLIYGVGEKRTENVFDSQKDIYKAVQKEFKAAQDNVETKYLIPDMEIQYVSKKNNFDSYTIFDTPGPDAAGTDHYKSTNKAIEDCDVAVFAIDYSKYLTSSEEEFLSRVKEAFEAKQKFHTLIFTINKIDMALQDKGAKSRIKSIDYIRNRIMEIDDKYKDCVIFATSARDYFYTLELEAEAQKNEVCRELLDKELFTNLRSALGELDDSEQDTIDLLSKIDAEVCMLATQLGHKKVYTETLKNYSGMPQLLSYISYIAKSKAREEIVNSITYMIDAEISRLQGIIDNVANIEKLINANESSIGRIREILDRYYNGTKAILDKENLLESELEVLDKEENINFFGYIEVYKKIYGNIRNINIDKFCEICREGFEKYNLENMQSAIKEKILNNWFEKINRICRSGKKYVNKDELSIDKKIYIDELNSNLKNFTNRKLRVLKDNLTGSVENFKELLNNRLQKVEILSEDCKKSLAKEDCVLRLPELPSFDISFAEVNLSIPNIEKNTNAYKFNDASLLRGSISQFFSNLWNGRGIFSDYEEVEVGKLTKFEINSISAQITSGIYKWLSDDVHLNDVISNLINELKLSVYENEARIKETFCYSNKVMLENINKFRDTIDDTEKYRNDNAALSRKQVLTQRIELASKEFIDTWAEIIGDEIVKG